MEHTRIRLHWGQKAAVIEEYKRRREAGHRFTCSDIADWAKKKFVLPEAIHTYTETRIIRDEDNTIIQVNNGFDTKK